jgi:hypothetical protein
MTFKYLAEEIRCICCFPTEKEEQLEALEQTFRRLFKESIN